MLSTDESDNLLFALAQYIGRPADGLRTKCVRNDTISRASIGTADNHQVPTRACDGQRTQGRPLKAERGRGRHGCRKGGRQSLEGFSTLGVNVLTWPAVETDAP